MRDTSCGDHDAPQGRLIGGAKAVSTLPARAPREVYARGQRPHDHSGKQKQVSAGVVPTVEYTDPNATSAVRSINNITATVVICGINTASVM